MPRNTAKEPSCGISLAQKVNSTGIEKLLQKIKASGLGNEEAFVQHGREQHWWLLWGRGCQRGKARERTIF